MQSNYRDKINASLKELSNIKNISSAILVCNTLLEYMGIEIKNVEDIELSKLKLPNAERYDRWFDPHPHFRGNRACFELTPKDKILEAKFYSLQKRSKLFIAGSVNFTPNFEDRDYTRKDPNMKVGIDFFFTPEKDGVIVVLSNRGNLRLIELSGRLTNTQNEIFDLWYNIAQTTDKNILHTTIWESFKLSSLNEQFYKGMVNSFTSLTQHLQENNTEEQIANQFANRLLGRLLFLWFLRKKNIINESKEYFTIGNQDDTEYYANKLNALFFNVLNNENHKDFDPITPYLNGGLFDQNSDGEYWKNNKPTFPIGFFEKLYNHFDSFNFTTDESTPEYEQIAIDPEMLGRIFESFLATLKTETGAQAKKANGAFYTPREIVSYMSRESLRQYLYTVLNADNILKTSIDDLLDLSNSNWALAGTNSKRDAVVKEDRKRIIDALLNIKVLDPAVGSGAFPMGILHKIISLFERLEPNFDPYETKLSILKNNIYGVDIDPKAIEISRLRAWLSIIVDIKDVKKIKPLPNLEFKFVCANSLVGLDSSKQMSLTSDTHLKSTLMRIRDEYYATSNKKLKEKLQKEYIKLTHPGQSAIFDTEKVRQLKSYQPFEIGKSASFYDPELMHGVISFDVVIGNPPYIDSEGMVKSGQSELRQKIQKEYNWTKGNWDIYIAFFELGFKYVSKEGVLTYITPDKWISKPFGDYLRKGIIENIFLILKSGRKIFDSAKVDSIITFLSKKKHQKISVVEYKDEEFITKKVINKNILIPPFRLDYLFSENLDFLEKISIFTDKISNFGNCENACATSDAYKLKSFIENINGKDFNENDYFKIINTGTIAKYYSRWGRKEMTYLKEKYLCPVVNKKIFLENFKNSYGKKSLEPKIIIKGLNLLDGCIDLDGIIIPAKTTLVITAKDIKILKFILALINSDIAIFYIKEKYPASSYNQGTTFTKDMINDFPVPKNLKESDRENIVNEVNQILDIVHRKDFDMNKKQQLDISIISERINNLFFNIYGLTDKERAMIKK